MELEAYLRQVSAAADNAAALADDDTKVIAQRIVQSIEPSVRLALLQALTDATEEISAELAPGSVDLQMRGDQPQFVVRQASDAARATYLEPDDEPEAEPAADSEEDSEQVRVTLRLPKQTKERVDQRAATAGVSVNSWLTAAVTNELGGRRRGPGGPRRGHGHGPRGGGPDFGPGPFGGFAGGWGGGPQAFVQKLAEEFLKPDTPRQDPEEDDSGDQHVKGWVK